MVKQMIQTGMALLLTLTVVGATPAQQQCRLVNGRKVCTVAKAPVKAAAKVTRRAARPVLRLFRGR
jgi:hypothetical protein